MLRHRNFAPALPLGPAAQPVQGEHVGVLVPWANMVVEGELPVWADGHVVWHYARLAPPDGGTALTRGFLTGLIEAVPEGLHQLSRLPLERVYLACTSAAFTQQHAVKQVIADAPVEVVTAFDAISTILHTFGLRHVALAAPYPPQVTSVEVEAFEARGITVTVAASLGLDDGYATITSDQITGLVRGIHARDLSRADAVVLSCTGWPTQGALQRLRHDLARPVISSNLAICMHARRSSP